MEGFSARYLTEGDDGTKQVSFRVPNTVDTSLSTIFGSRGTKGQDEFHGKRQGLCLAPQEAGYDLEEHLGLLATREISQLASLKSDF